MEKTWLKQYPAGVPAEIDVAQYASLVALLDESFRRYAKSVGACTGKPVRVTVDFFVRSDVPFREIDGWRVVEPRFLLSLYSNIHSSDKCFAVQAARKLIEKGIDPVGRSELVEIPT